MISKKLAHMKASCSFGFGDPSAMMAEAMVLLTILLYFSSVQRGISFFPSCTVYHFESTEYIRLWKKYLLVTKEKSLAAEREHKLQGF